MNRAAHSNGVCPACGAAGAEVFYTVRGVPVHACVLLDDREAACRYPRGDMALGWCAVCGFISNVLMDGRVPAPSASYEDQQAFSPRFRAFQTGLVRRLVEEEGICGRDVVEIGCGRGDFLRELCAAGGNRGVGIDPLCPAGEERVGEGRVRFIGEAFSERHSELPFDLVCCRHTLEHIPAVRAFVARLHRVMRGRRDGLVLFEVPDVGRILRERAFWDIYYEHCSYFTAGSLAGLFRRVGFEVLDVEHAFGGQYLLLLARPAGTEVESSQGPVNDHRSHDGLKVDARPLAGARGSDPLIPLARARGSDRLASLACASGSKGGAGHEATGADALETTPADEIASFGAAVREQIEGWRRRLVEEHGRGRRVAIWGSGSKCVGFLSAVGRADVVSAVVDINPRRHGKFLAGSGCRIVPPEHLRVLPPDLVLVMNPVYEEEIRGCLGEMGLQSRVMCV